MNQKSKVRDLVFIAVGAALISVCSWISIPSTVPFTLQTFAVFFILGLLGGWRGTMSVIVYIFLGAVGIPVFSGFTGGFAKLAGMTGGYIIGFIFMGLMYWLILRIFKDRLIVRIIALLAGLLVCYAFGTVWYMVVYARQSGPVGVGAALGMCVIPFILPDLAKLSAAVFISSKMKRLLHI